MTTYTEINVRDIKTGSIALSHEYENDTRLCTVLLKGSKVPTLQFLFDSVNRVYRRVDNKDTLVGTISWLSETEWSFLDLEQKVVFTKSYFNLKSWTGLEEFEIDIVEHFLQASET